MYGKVLKRQKEHCGQTLIDFCNIHKLFVTNSAFQHKASQMTTFENHRIVNNKVINCYTQIDFVLCRHNHKNTLIDARSFSNTQLSSDNRIVICRMSMEKHHIYKNGKKKIIQKNINKYKLTKNLHAQQIYKLICKIK